MTVQAVSKAASVVLRPIADSDSRSVGSFLHQHLNSRLSPETWAAAMAPAWAGDAPNRGFMLLEGGRVVGAQLAFYSLRRSGERICNLAALCVLPDYRMHSLRLLKAALSQPGYSFTDLSPSGNVRPLNMRLGFQALDTRTALVFNPLSLPMSGVRLVSDPERLFRLLAGRDREIYRDHLDARAAHQLALVAGERYCHVIYRRDRRKNLPLFATILHVSDRALFARAGGRLFSHLFWGHGIPFTLAELRVVGHRPMPSYVLAAHRPKMYRSDSLAPESIDYLYSELTCVAW